MCTLDLFRRMEEGRRIVSMSGWWDCNETFLYRLKSVFIKFFVGTISSYIEYLLKLVSPGECIDSAHIRNFEISVGSNAEQARIGKVINLANEKMVGHSESHKLFISCPYRI
jgi:hypothetical protein